MLKFQKEQKIPKKSKNSRKNSIWNFFLKKTSNLDQKHKKSENRLNRTSSTVSTIIITRIRPLSELPDSKL